MELGRPSERKGDSAAVNRKKIVILGSTGSVGENAVKVAKHLHDRINVVGIAARRDIKKLSAQARELGCKWVAVSDETKTNDLKKNLPSSVKVLSGEEGLIEISSLPEADMTLCAISGAAGLLPVVHAIKARKDIALATKEALVMSGEIIMDMVKKTGTKLLPVDSEHSAIFQCLEGKRSKDVEKLILTASGGPFKDFSLDDMKKVSCEMALAHPTWAMGPKISIDSATLMNKALEIIEARWLFDISADKIETVIHPQSVIHSMVEFIDGTILAQMSAPDMKFPIQYALTYPEKMRDTHEKLDFAKYSRLSFELPDRIKFPSLDFASFALKEGGTMPAVMNAANEVAVERFRTGKINFTSIWVVIEKVMSAHKTKKKPDMPTILAADKWAIETASQLEI